MEKAVKVPKISKQNMKQRLKILRALGRPIMKEAAAYCGVTRMGLHMYLNNERRGSIKGIPTKLMSFIEEGERELRKLQAEI